MLKHEENLIWLIDTSCQKKPSSATGELMNVYELFLKIVTITQRRFDELAWYINWYTSDVHITKESK